MSIYTAVQTLYQMVCYDHDYPDVTFRTHCPGAEMMEPALAEFNKLRDDWGFVAAVFHRHPDRGDKKMIARIEANSIHLAALMPVANNNSIVADSIIFNIIVDLFEELLSDLMDVLYDLKFIFTHDHFRPRPRDPPEDDEPPSKKQCVPLSGDGTHRITVNPSNPT